MSVSNLRLAFNVAFIAISALAMFLLGLLILLERSAIVGATLITLAVVYYYLFAHLWMADAGRTVVKMRVDGFQYYERFVPWSDISDVVIQRGTRQHNLVVTLKSGKTITILDDYLDHSMDELLYHIKKRI